MSRRRLRPLARISYYEPEEPALDEYIFCEKCCDYVFEYCSIHGALLVIPDDKVRAWECSRRSPCRRECASGRTAASTPTDSPPTTAGRSTTAIASRCTWWTRRTGTTPTGCGS